MNRQTNEYDYILNNFNLKNKKILDVGCGNYRNTLKFLANKPKLLVGVDNKKPNIKLNKRKCLFVSGNCQNLTFKKNTFDVVTCIRVLPYVNIDKTIKEISKITKSNGVILISSHGIGYSFLELFKKHKLSAILCIFNGILYNLFNIRFKNIDTFQLKCNLVKILKKYDIDIIDEIIFKHYGPFKILFMLHCKKNNH